MTDQLLLFYILIGGILIVGFTTLIIDLCTRHYRIKSDFNARGYKILKIQKAKIGQGLLAYESPYIFAIRYLDSEGNEHQVTCHPHLFLGNRLSNDVVLKYARRNTTLDLKKNSEKLKSELQILEERHQLEIDALKQRKVFLLSEIERLKN